MRRCQAARRKEGVGRGSPRGQHRVAMPDATVRVSPLPSGKIVSRQFRRFAHGAADDDLRPFRIHLAQATTEAGVRFAPGFELAQRARHTVQPLRGKRYRITTDTPRCPSAEQ